MARLRRAGFKTESSARLPNRSRYMAQPKRLRFSYCVMNEPKRQDLQCRTRLFALAVIRLADVLPRTMAASVIGKQLIRCATSVGANYRAACHGKSTADFIAKLKICEEEADESCYWLDLLKSADIMPPQRIDNLCDEAGQLAAIFATACKTAKKNAE